MSVMLLDPADSGQVLMTCVRSQAVQEYNHQLMACIVWSPLPDLSCSLRASNSTGNNFDVGLSPSPPQVVRQPQIHQRLLSILGDLVARERAGEMVDRALIKATTQVRIYLLLRHNTFCQLCVAATC